MNSTKNTVMGCDVSAKVPKVQSDSETLREMLAQIRDYVGEATRAFDTPPASVTPTKMVLKTELCSRCKGKRVVLVETECPRCMGSGRHDTVIERPANATDASEDRVIGYGVSVCL